MKRIDWAYILTREAASGYDKSFVSLMGAIKVPLFSYDNPELPSIELIAVSQEKYPPR